MAPDQRRRQKKLAKKARKQKARAKTIKRTASAIYGLGQLSSAPIHDVIIPKGIFDKGMGNVLLSRDLGHGFFALSIFLVDMYCLGVKNASFSRVTVADYEYSLVRYHEDILSSPVSPACVRKLVEGAVDYAQGLGFTPHNDYKKAYRIFGDIQADECNMEFEYGYEGKPMFVSGPYDSPAKCKLIIDRLTKNVGADGFHFMMEESGFDIYS